MKGLPDGSVMIVSRTGRDAIITIPKAINVSAFGGGLFLIVWLGGWAFGEYFVIRQLLSGEGDTGGRLFMMVWLVGWTIGGFFAASQAKRIFTPPKPEIIAMDAGGLSHDAGTPPLETGAKARFNWGAVTGRSEKTHIDRRALETLTLRDNGGRNRLTVDVGVNRIELGQSLTDVEREWLYDAICDRYQLTEDRGKTIDLKGPDGLSPRPITLR